MGTCNTCQKRGDWQQQTPRDRQIRPYLLAECHHRPLPPFWGSVGAIWVMSECGSKCPHYVERDVTPNVGIEPPKVGSNDGLGVLGGETK